MDASLGLADAEPARPIFTMGRYQLRGTPSLVVIDRAGRLRLNAFRRIDDLTVGATLARLAPALGARPTSLTLPIPSVIRAR